MFVKRPDLFLPWMEGMKEFAPAQAEGLERIFERHELPRAGRILDLASGIGRISISLAKRGYEVVGADISPLYLDYARKWAANERLEDKVRFYRLDAREVTKQLRDREKRFDAIINLGTAMGYYGEKEDLRTFSGLRAVAASKALLVIETVNRDYLIKNFQPHGISNKAGMEWHETRNLNLETSFMENSWRFYRKKPEDLELELDVHVSHRVYSLHELKNLIESAGWKYLESYGSLRELTPLTTDSFHMTLVSQKSTTRV